MMVVVHVSANGVRIFERVMLSYHYVNYSSTRYTKALEALSKAKKEYASKSKDLKADLMELAAYLHTAKQFRTDAQTVGGSRDECAEELSRLRIKLDQNEVKVCCKLV